MIRTTVKFDSQNVCGAKMTRRCPDPVLKPNLRECYSHVRIFISINTTINVSKVWNSILSPVTLLNFGEYSSWSGCKNHCDLKRQIKWRPLEGPFQQEVFCGQTFQPEIFCGLTCRNVNRSRDCSRPIVFTDSYLRYDISYCGLNN